MRKSYATKSNKREIQLLIVSVVILLLMAVIIPITIAYFSDRSVIDGGGIVGEVGLEFYHNDSLVSPTPISISQPDIFVITTSFTLTGQNTNTNLKMKNTGTINGIVRLIGVTIKDASNNVLSTTQVSTTLLDEDNDSSSLWVSTTSDTGYYIPTEHFYYSYYNQILSQNVTTSVISQISVPSGSTLIGQTITITFQAEILAHSGNVYQDTTPQKPWGVLTGTNPATNMLTRWVAWQAI